MGDTEPSEVKSVSLQKVEANRRNALKSTGPRAPRGKANVRSNAVKHGFFSKQVVISSKAIGEDPKEFEALLQRLWDHYQPADIAKELLVETIAGSGEPCARNWRKWAMLERKARRTSGCCANSWMSCMGRGKLSRS